MARVRVTPIIRRRRGFAGLPGYVSSPWSQKVRPRVTEEEWRAQRTRMLEMRKEWDLATSEVRLANEQEGPAYHRRYKRWSSMNDYASNHPYKNWKKLAEGFKFKKVTLEECDMTPANQWISIWDRVDAITIPPRDKGYWGGLRFITHLERAFVKAGVPGDLQSDHAADLAGREFFSWYSHTTKTYHQHIPWRQFTWGLFVFIMAYET